MIRRDRHEIADTSTQAIASPVTLSNRLVLMRVTEVANLLHSDRGMATQPLMNHIPRPEYPRPTVVRSEWLNLNGSWRFRCDDEQVGLQQAWYKGPLSDAEVITVPFAPNAAASGIFYANGLDSIATRRNPP